MWNDSLGAAASDKRKRLADLVHTGSTDRFGVTDLNLPVRTNIRDDMNGHSDTVVNSFAGGFAEGCQNVGVTGNYTDVDLPHVHDLRSVRL